MKKNKGAHILATVALIILANPNFNMIDYFPDCIAYFILLGLIGRRDEILPYLAETKVALTRLAITTLARLPAMAIMYVNMSSGRDIIPLFTLIFSIIEAIFLYSAISNGSRALYYLGERSNATVLITPYKFLKSTVRVESLTTFTYVFVFAKALLNFIPELCQLTFGSDKLRYLASILYLPLELSCIGTVLVLGFVWLLLASKFVFVIKRSCRLDEEIEALAGEEKLDRLRSERGVRALLNSLTLLSVSSLFCFDLAFDSSGGMNILPHFIFGILIYLSVYKLIEQKRYRIISGVGCALYSVFSAVVYVLSHRFADEFTLFDIAQYTVAADRYEVIASFATLECLSFMLFIGAVMIGFRRFILTHTGAPVSSESYSASSKKHHAELTKRGFGLFGVMLLLSILKCIHVNMLGDPEIIYTETGAVVATPIPWFSTLVFAVSVVLVFYAFLYLGELKNEVKIRYGITDKQ